MSKLLNTLNYQIYKNLKETIYVNEAYKKNRWGLVERQILTWSTRYPFYTMLLVVAFISCVVAVYMWYPDVIRMLPKFHQSWRNVMSWPEVVFAGQLTIIGVIFPIVIGFVGQFLKDRSANRALWKIFNHYSGFMFAGFSGLMLSAVVLFGQFTRPWQYHAFDVVFAFGICIWFLFNLLLTAWFLRATFVFMGTEERSNLVLRYCINEALIFEIKRRLSKVIPVTAIQTGLLDKNVNDSPQVEIYYFIKSIAPKPHTKKFKSTRIIGDIRFRLLNLGIRAWKKSASTSSEKGKSRLILPLDNVLLPKKEWDFASTVEVDLDFVSKLLLKCSYKFQKPQTPESSIIRLTIHALVGNIDDALRDRNVRLFGMAIDEMVQWHSDLMNAASFINDNSEYDNWLLLSEGTFFGRTIIQELSQEYFEVNRGAVQLLTDSNQYFHTLCYFPLNIYSKKSGGIAGSVTKQLLDDHYRIWVALMNWHHESLETGHVSITSNQHESAIRHFVGSWEAWASPSRLSLEFNQWSKCAKEVGPYIHHLELTAKLIITAIRNDEQSGAEWAVDMLLRWHENMFRHKLPPYHFYWKKELLAPFLLGEDTSSPIWKQILNGTNLDEKAAVTIAIENAWTDVRLVVAVYCLNRPNSLAGNLASEIARTLLNGKRPRPTNNTNDIRPIGNGRDILQAYIRHRWLWQFDSAQHAQWLDDLVASFGRIEKDEMVSGRVYAGWGSLGVESLQEIYIAIAISFSGNEWELSSDIVDFIFSDVLELQHREHLIRTLNIWKVPTEKSVEMAKMFKGDNYKPEYLNNFKQSIEKIVSQVEDKNQKDISIAPIDNERLLKIGRKASGSAFTQDSRCPPIWFFSEISYVEKLDQDAKHIINIENYQRSDVAAGVHGGRAVNEDEWFEEMVSDDVSLNLYRRLIQVTADEERKYDDNRLLLERTIVDATSLKHDGLKPILLVGPWSIYTLLDSILWGYGKGKGDERFEVRKDDGYPEAYLCHLNDIEVYRMPFNKIGFCLLVPKECFDIVQIRQINSGQFVEANFIENGLDKTRGILRLTYWMEAHFKKVPLYKYVTSVEEV